MKNIIVLLFLSAISLILSFRIMGAMMHYDNATVIFSSDSCPLIKDVDGICKINGSVSRTFINEDTEVTLEDGSVHVFSKDYSHGIVFGSNPVRYEPFGKIASFFIGLFLMLLFPLVFILSSKKKNKLAE